MGRVVVRTGRLAPLRRLSAVAGVVLVTGCGGSSHAPNVSGRAQGSGAAGAVPLEGGLIAFDSDRAGGGPDIYVVKSDGSNPRRLTHTEQSVGPSWSPDGKTIAYSTKARGRDVLSIMNADGTGQRRLKGAGSGYGPVFSPDGRKLAFTRGNCDPERCEIYVVDADGQNARQLTRAGRNALPSWSPDGEKIAFTHFTDDGPRVYVMNADGSNAHQLTAQNGYEPSWSPDGRIVFVRETADNSALYVMRSDGSDVHPVMQVAEPAEEPRWSPSGKQIVFHTQQTLWVINADGSAPIRVAFDGNNHDPSWQPSAQPTVARRSPARKRAAPPGFRLFGVPGYDISFALPESWASIGYLDSPELARGYARKNPYEAEAELVDSLHSLQSGRRFVASSPGGNAEVIVSIEQVPRTTTLQQHIEGALRDLEGESRIRITGRHDDVINVAGGPAWRIRWGFTGRQRVPVEIVQYAFVRDGLDYRLDYLFTFRAVGKPYEQFAHVFDTAASSIRFARLAQR